MMVSHGVNYISHYANRPQKTLCESGRPEREYAKLHGPEAPHSR